MSPTPRMHRRRVLALSSVALTAGCSGILPSDSTPTPTEAPESTPTPTPVFREATNPNYTPDSNPLAENHDRGGGLELEDGEYALLPIESDDPIRLRYAYEVTSGGNIDVHLMRRSALESFRDREGTLRYLQDGSVVGQAGGRVETSVSADEYVLVFDNSYRSETAPDGTVQLRYGLSTTARFRQANDPEFSPDSNPYAEDYGVRNGGLALRPGTYKSFAVSVDRTFTLRYAFDVIDGGPIDAFLMSGDAFDSYQDEEQQFAFYQEATRQGSEGDDVAINLPGGDHVLVFDNSYLGKTAPDGPARMAYGLGFGEE